MENTVNAGNSKQVLISQKDHYAGNFGEVLRSSAIFWVKQDEAVRTTISFANYWSFKNSTEVSVLVNLRELDGTLRSRKKIQFETSQVCNFVPPQGFEGSVEVEVFSTRNMRIPYAAVMAVYECRDSISMVHSYARAYSQHEIEDRRTLCDGEESCWTLRETDEWTSWCVFHNGSLPMEAQKVRLGLRNSQGEERVVSFDLPALKPFETRVIDPSSHHPELREWLGGQPGNARISFKLAGGFTRLLCGVRARDWSQAQVTHSNFDYSVHRTDRVEVPSAKAIMYTPTVLKQGVSQEVVVYPDTDPGRYSLVSGEWSRRFQTSEIVRKEFEDNLGRQIEFSREDQFLPTRIVTGIRLNSGPEVIPAECSLGVVHQGRPAKHFAWMVVSEDFGSAVCWADLNQVFGGCPDDAELVFQLHVEARNEPWVRSLRYRELPREAFVHLRDLFGEGHELAKPFAYLTVWSSYPGLMFFSTLRKRGSISIEHSF